MRLRFRPCSKCGGVFPATDEFFYRQRGRLRPWCKLCVLDLNHQSYANWMAEHRDERLARKREYRQLNLDSAREYDRQYRESHRDERSAYKHWRRSATQGSNGSHTANDTRAQFDRQKGRCYWCGKSAGSDYHVDHVVPLKLGGSNGPENIVVACATCNLSKNATHPMDFAGRML